jgi:divalent metal cation (Fe/Co/Zn/Cd) transporter
MGVAFILIVIKLWAWTATGSVALLTSAIDAAVDAVASLATFVGVRYAERTPPPEAALRGFRLMAKLRT